MLAAILPTAVWSDGGGSWWCWCTNSARVTKMSISPYFRSWKKLIMHHFVPEYNEPFGIHVNTQTVFILANILDTYDVCYRLVWYVPGIIHALSYVWYNHSSNITPSNTTECCCFLLLAVVVRLDHTGLARARFGSWSTPSCFMKHFLYANLVGALFFSTYLVGCLAFFQFWVSQSTRANKRNDSSSVTASGRYQRGAASHLP